MIGNKNARTEARLAALGLTLPALPAAVGAYLPYRQVGDLVFVSGQLPWVDGRIAHPGRVGADVALDDAVTAARLCALALIAQMQDACVGDLDRIVAVVRLGGFVACAPDFVDHARVINGASELMADVFGDAGRHARAAIGCASLPLNAPVEIEGLFQIRHG